MRQSYKPSRVKITLQEERKASWGRPGGAAVKGTEFLYVVKDENFRSINEWVFAVRVPKSVYADIAVQPVKTPSKKVWAGVERRAIVFVRGTIHPYRRKVYCKLNLADPTEEHNKRGTRRGERSSLPKWFDYFRRQMRLKQTVATTAGTDAKAQVVLVKLDHHERMIRLYFAMKVWVLEEDFILERD